MNKETQKIIHDLKSLSLDSKAKGNMRARLSEYANLKPVRTEIPKGTKKKNFSFFSARPAVIAVFSMILVTTFTGVGVSQAARGSVPGDTLYTVKININEPIQTFFAFTPVQEAEVLLEHAEARLTELTTLSKRDTIDSRTRQTLSDAYKGLINKAERIAVDMEKRDIVQSDKVRTSLLSLEKEYTQLVPSEELPALVTPTTNMADTTKTTDKDTTVATPEQSPPILTSETTEVTDTIEQVEVRENNRQQILIGIERAKAVIAEAESLLRTTNQYEETEGTLDEMQKLLDVVEENIETKDTDSDVQATTSTRKVRRGSGSSRNNTNDTQPPTTTNDDTQNAPSTPPVEINSLP